MSNDATGGAGRRVALLAATLLGAATLLCTGAQTASALTVTSASLHAVEGASYGGEIGRFSGDSLLFCSASNYSATVTWGDASSASSATITAAPGSSCNFVISVPGNEARRFPEETTNDASNRSYKLQVNGPLFAQASGTGTATVDDAALTAGPAQLLSGVEGSTITGTVATFSDANPGASASDFSATVDWGDGSPPTSATVSADAGHFDVSAGHAYLSPGPHTASVTITDAGGSGSSTQAQIDVVLAPAGSSGVAIAPSSPTTSAPSATPTSSANAKSLPVPKLVISKPRFGNRGSILVVLECPAGGADCRGDVVLSALADPRARDKRLRHGIALGSSLFILSAGSSERLDVRLSKSMHRLLAHAGSVRARVVATSFGPSGSVASAGSVGTLRRAR
jgi:hypothetical protein